MLSELSLKFATYAVVPVVLSATALGNDPTGMGGPTTVPDARSTALRVLLSELVT